MIHDVHVNCWPTSIIPYDHDFQIYIALKEEVFYDYRDRPNYKKLFDEARQSHEDLPVEKLLRGLGMKDEPLILELCLRRFSGWQYDRPFDFSDSMEVLRELSGHAQFGYFRCLHQSPYSNPFTGVLKPSMSMSVLFTDGMLRFAAACAMINFIPPIVLRIASWAMSCNTLYGIDVWRKPLGAPYECKEGLSIISDDGDPEWVDVETIEPPSYEDDNLPDMNVWEINENPEIFVDIPEKSWYRKGDVYRIRTKCLSPALLRSYKDLWEVNAVSFYEALMLAQKQIEIYVTLQQEICYDYRDQPSYQTLYDNAIDSFKTMTPHKLKRGLDLRLAPLMFELSLRGLAESLPKGMGCPVEPMDLIQYLAEVGGMPHHDKHVYYADPILRLRAVAALGWIFFRQFFWSPYLDCFETAHAASIIKQCAFQGQVLAISGFVPPIVLRIAGWLSTVQARYAKLDARTMLEDFEKMDTFWMVYEGYLERQKMEEEKRLAKVAKAPNRYRCAAEGCGIQAVNKSALRKCGGDCSLDKKPHYCSVDCQAQHWFVHRFVCKGSECPNIVEDDGDPAWEDVETYRPASGIKAMLDGKALWADHDREGPEIFIDIPNTSRYRNESLMANTTPSGSARATEW
ncbi:hypothetical protein GSI_00572 [Ganoderma sinense ZZ0214-1]|uniref:MYND-type domain-containing protein n=1 Tax=Ganoderma sinense ZZ0214-1 TaxID=1077348 RepID=A0A2G8ST23_9APHY|nr:hypothetical protein GSI_00572 [Ganoderma sinense ZZ0214-1]